MTHMVVRSLWRGLFVSLTALVFLVSPAFAGDDQNPASNSVSTASQPSPPAPDFLLGRPHAMVGVRGSWLIGSANSDFYDDMTKFLTLEKSDFRTGSFTTELAVSLAPHLDVVGGFDMNSLSHASEDRAMEELLADGRRVPIQQTTSLSEKNFYVSAKYSLLSRGQSVSRLAWVPRTFVPYVGAGAGYGSYNLRQNGDFVDQGNPGFTGDETIFTDTFRSEGWTPLFQAFGGTDIQIYRHLVISFEGRYTWKKADLSSDYVGYEPLDLGGMRFGAGVHFTF